MIHLRAVDDAGFAAFVQRAIPRRAERWTRRGLWRAENAIETSRREYAETFPQGRATPGHHIFEVIDDAGSIVGEAWYSARANGGKVDFYIQWIAIWPEHRGRGLGTALLGLLEGEARRLGADRTSLTVWEDNPAALALYTRLGYTTAHRNLIKILDDVAPPVH